MPGVLPERVTASQQRDHGVLQGTRPASLKLSLNDYWLGHPSDANKLLTEAWLFRGRVVEMVDGWTVTMADTPENQEEYPQMTSQKPRLRFPDRPNDRRVLSCHRSNQLHCVGCVQGKANGRDVSVTNDLRPYFARKNSVGRSLLRQLLVDGSE